MSSQLRTSLPHRTSSSSHNHTISGASNTTQATPIASAPQNQHPTSTNDNLKQTVSTHSPTHSQTRNRSRSTSVASGSSNTAPQASVRPSKQQTTITHSAVELVRRIVSPSSILFENQPLPAPTRQRISGPPHRQANMDRRHPSSFQQLEKLGEGTYATVC